MVISPIHGFLSRFQTPSQTLIADRGGIGYPPLGKFRVHEIIFGLADDVRSGNDVSLGFLNDKDGDPMDSINTLEASQVDLKSTLVRICSTNTTVVSPSTPLISSMHLDSNMEMNAHASVNGVVYDANLTENGVDTDMLTSDFVNSTNIEPPALTFDWLVSYKMNKRLANRATTKNPELLIFTSFAPH